MKNLEIIYEDNDIILCHKPAGVATQTKRLGQQDMESLLKNYRANKGEPPYIGVVHRLDQPVEGIMVFSKNQKATSSLSKQIQGKMIGKYYYAVSAYKPKEEKGVLENYLITDKKTNFTQVVEEMVITEKCNPKNSTKNQHFIEKTKTASSSEKQEWNKEEIREQRNHKELQNFAKLAKLEYRVVTSMDEKTLFDIKLHTGRQHQIRVQMAHIGCPLIGDEKYAIKTKESEGRISNEGADANVQVVRKDYESPLYNHHGKAKKMHEMLALCSYRLQFQHPVTKKQMDFCISPKGEIFQEFVSKIK